MRLDLAAWAAAWRDSGADGARHGEPVDRRGSVHMNRDEPLVLGIETSCDETGIGIVRGRTLLSNTIASSMDEHARYGGVVPEVAARAHLEALQPSIEAALAEAGVALADIDAVAVTSGPGLAGALMVGVGAAKALAVSLERPLYAVNHLVGHIAADILDADAPPLEYPTVALLVSGGHTSLLLVRDLTTDVELLGETMDDAAGEAFDKVARLLGLPVSRAVPRSTGPRHPAPPTAIPFPRGLSRASDMAKHRYDFSFSGLKTAVARWVEQRRGGGRADPDRRCRGILPRSGRRRARDEGARGVRRPRRAAPAARRRRHREQAPSRCGDRASGCRGRDGPDPPAVALHRQRRDDRRARVGADHGRASAVDPRLRRGLDAARDRDPGGGGGSVRPRERVSPGRRSLSTAGLHA